MEIIPIFFWECPTFNWPSKIWGWGDYPPSSIQPALTSFMSILQLEAIDAYGVRNCLFDEKLTAYNCCSSMPCPYHFCDIYIPMCWVDLSFISMVILDFFLVLKLSIFGFKSRTISNILTYLINKASHLLSFVCSNGFYVDIWSQHQVHQYKSCLKSFLKFFGSFELP